MTGIAYSLFMRSTYQVAAHPHIPNWCIRDRHRDEVNITCKAPRASGFSDGFCGRYSGDDAVVTMEGGAPVPNDVALVVPASAVFTSMDNPTSECVRSSIGMLNFEW